MKEGKASRKTEYPQWPHPTGAYGDIQPVFEPPIRRVIKRALQWTALFVCFLIFLIVFGLGFFGSSWRFCDEVKCVFVR